MGTAHSVRLEHRGCHERDAAPTEDEVTRGERQAIIAAVLILGGVIAIFTTGALGWLNDRLEFSAGANVIQWISGPATFAAVVVVIYHYFVRRCATPWCVRYGEHPVEGTLQKVCHCHHTLEHHRLVWDIHHEAHQASERLLWGESHKPPVKRKPRAHRAEAAT